MSANSTVEGHVASAMTVRTVTAKSVMLNENSFWVLYSQHTEPTYIEDAGAGQQAQRDNGLRYVKQWRNAIDVGANVGEWTRPLAKKFKRVVCFEPNPNFRKCFVKNITETNVVLWPYGLSEKEHKAKQNFNATQLQNEDGNIDCRPLDSFRFTDVDYIKIDVDGFEIPVLRGASWTLQKNSPVINIEMKRRKRPEIVAQAQFILQRWGYKFVSRERSDEIWIKK